MLNCRCRRSRPALELFFAASLGNLLRFRKPFGFQTFSLPCAYSGSLPSADSALRLNCFLLPAQAICFAFGNLSVSRRSACLALTRARCLRQTPPCAKNKKRRECNYPALFVFIKTQNICVKFKK